MLVSWHRTLCPKSPYPSCRFLLNLVTEAFSENHQSYCPPTPTPCLPPLLHISSEHLGPHTYKHVSLFYLFHPCWNREFRQDRHFCEFCSLWSPVSRTCLVHKSSPNVCGVCLCVSAIGKEKQREVTLRGVGTDNIEREVELMLLPLIDGLIVKLIKRRKGPNIFTQPYAEICKSKMLKLQLVQNSISLHSGTPTLTLSVWLIIHWAS